MGFRLIQPKKVKKVKSHNAQEVLDRLEGFLDGNLEEPIKVLCGFWKDQQSAISYQELRQAVLDGQLSEQTLRDWQNDYSVLVKNELAPMWEKAMKAGPSGQPLLDGLEFELNMQTPGILTWINERGAEFVTASSIEQREAIAALLEKKIRDEHTVDELSKMIRPCIGLTDGQAKANVKYYDHVVKTLTEEHPRMSKASIRKKALEASTKYAEKQHRQRAFTIAHTESAFAYNRGADQGIRQAMSARLIGPCVKVWSTSGDANVCATCNSLEGTEVGMDDEFGYKGRVLFSGHKLLPPAHPMCACAIEYREIEAPKEIDDYIAEVYPGMETKGYYGDQMVDFREVVDEMPPKVKEVLKDTTVVFGSPRNPRCDLVNNTIYLSGEKLSDGSYHYGKNSMYHEIGHLVDQELVDDTAKRDLLTKIINRSTVRDIVEEVVDGTKIVELKSTSFISEYQGRIYADMNAVINDYSLMREKMVEFISEGFREYWENPNNLKKVLPELYELIERSIL